MALRTSARKASRCAGSTIDTGRLFQSGEPSKGSMPSPSERAVFGTRAMSASDHCAYSPISATDCRPARAAISSFSSKEPFKVHSITELVILAFGGALDCDLASAAPATSAAPVFRSSLRSITMNARIARVPYTTQALSVPCYSGPRVSHWVPDMREYSFTTPHGIAVTRTVTKAGYRRGLKHLLRDLDCHRGIYLSSGYEFPGRYSRWDIASTRPPLEIVSYDRKVEFRPLSIRGEILNQILLPVLERHPHWESFACVDGALTGRLKPLPPLFPEEERSKQPSTFSILRALIEEFRNEENCRLALAGAFGYDLLFQFEPIEKKLPRNGHKDLHLFLCDDIYLMDRKKEQIERYRYDFEREGLSTLGLERTAEPIPPPPAREPGPIVSDHTPDEYMAGVETVREGMRRGDYYEVVLRQTFSTPYSGKASELFERVQRASPSPYEFLLQLGEEQLIGASPEMFVRVEGQRVETCPIAGTARRTGDPMRDAENIRE